MKEAIVVGTTSVIRHVFIKDSAFTDGRGKTGLVFGDFSCRYIQPGSTISGVITAQDIAALGTYAAPTANTNIRIKEIDSVNMVGWYEVQFHDNWFASGAMLSVHLSAAGAKQVAIEFQLTAFDLRTALTAEQTATAIFAHMAGLTATGTVPFSTIVKAILAILTGRWKEASANVYKVYDNDGFTLILTLTKISATEYRTTWA